MIWELFGFPEVDRLNTMPIHARTFGARRTNGPREIRPGLVAAVATGLAASLAWGQPGATKGSPDNQPGKVPGAAPAAAPGVTPDFASLPAEVRLGVRAEHVRRTLPTTSLLVIVPDERSFVSAISTWSTDEGGARFPILIDDGTLVGRENIARFVRAFKPARVVGYADATPAKDWRADELSLLRAQARAWGAAGDAADAAGVRSAIRAKWKMMDFQPPGIVAMHPTDPAWVGGLALAIGRGQEVVIVSDALAKVTDATSAWTFAQVLTLDRELRAAAGASGYRFDTLGDDLDAVTLALNISARAAMAAGDRLEPVPAQKEFVCKPGESLAITDLIGRDIPGASMSRWAYTGQLSGGASASAYRAMSSLFLEHRSALLLDGYEDSRPWNLYSASAAGRSLAGAGWETRVVSPPMSLEKFREATRAVDVSLLTLNSSGMSSFFDLKPGRGLTPDVPLLSRPSVAYVVHSWSSQNPRSVWTIAGRFLQRGAVGYVGSVHEPYLSGFLPTPTFVERLVAPVPLAAAARYADFPAWRIHVEGDPLLVMSRALPTAATSNRAKPALDPVADLQTELSEALKARNFEKAVLAMHLQGRDRDIVRLLGALMKEKREQVTPTLAVMGIMPAARSQDVGMLFELAAIARSEVAKLPEEQTLDLRDAVWHAALSRRDALTQAQVDLLRTMLRPEVRTRDAGEVAAMLARSRSKSAARAFLADVRDGLSDENARKEIDALIRNFADATP